jgi:vitellogenic carboxypeptidase-like protein
MSELAVLLDSYKVLIYNGDLDAVVSSAMVDAALLSTNWSLKDQYRDSVREVWSSGFDLKGFYTRTGQFCRAVIHGAGHQAPFDQPEISLDMMTQFINYGCIHIQTF